jgi:hypothetical protein
MKEQIRAWMNEKIVKGFYRAHSWLLNFFAFVIAVLPDVINLAISNVDSLVGSIPTLSVEHKLHLLMAVNVLSLFLKAYKQRKGPIAIAEQETVEATEVFVDGSTPVREWTADEFQKEDPQRIIREIEKHLAEQISSGTGDLSRAIRQNYTRISPDGIVTPSLSSLGSHPGRLSSGRIDPEAGPEAFAPIKRDPDGRLSVGEVK